MKERKRNSMALAVIAIIVVALSISVGNALAQEQPEIRIGAEIGPLYIFNSNDWFINPEHPVFIDSSYFLPQMARMGLDFQMGVYRDDLYDGVNPSEDRMAEIFQNNGLSLLLYGSNFESLEAPPVAFSGSGFMRRENLPWFNTFSIDDPQPPTELWHEDFFPAPGNSAELIDGDDDDDFPFWITNTNPNGFIIGDGEGDNVEDNWVELGNDYKAFCLGNSLPDHYKVRFLVKLVSQLQNPGANLLTLHVRSWILNVGLQTHQIPKTGTQVATDIANNPDDEENWGWIEFDVPSIGPTVNACTHAKFALQWHGDLDHGVIKARGISYQSFDSEQIFSDPNSPDLKADDVWFPFLEMVIDEFDRLGNSALGISAYEPWKYSWYPCNQLLSSLDDDIRDDHVFTAMYPISSDENDPDVDEIEQYLDETGVDNILFDCYPIRWSKDPADEVMKWHWEESSDGNDEGVPAKSIQNAWNDLMTWYGDARTAADARGKDLWLGIQASCDLEKNFDTASHTLQGILKWQAEPTPRMVKCQGFLAMTYAAKGFFYSYYGCQNTCYDHEGTYYWYVHPVPAHPTRWENVSGALVSGLVSLRVDTSDFNNIADTDAEILNASSCFGGNSSGWLYPNAKGWEAKEFNDYVRGVEPIYADLRFGASVCAEEDPDVEYLTVDGTYNIDEVDDEESWVQMGVFDGGNADYFMLVNRRCDEDGGRFVDCTVGNDLLTYAMVCKFEPGVISIISEGLGDRAFTVWLEPAEGRLFSVNHNAIGDDVDDEYIIRGDYWIDDPLTVTNTGTLIILPGSRICFLDDGSLTVYGQLEGLGKYDTEGDSSISFISLTNPITGSISLYGSAMDTFSYCKFNHLEKGLTISKSGNSKVKINHCEFSYNEAEGLYASGGEITITGSEFRENGGDGIYLYNCKAALDSLTIVRNVKNGVYCYSVNSSSSITNSSLRLNGESSNSYPDGNIRFFNCSPTLRKNEIVSGEEYGLYGANGSYPIMYVGTSNAANSVLNNGSHETYWDYSWPVLDEGHNNFSTEDDTVIYITAGTPLTYFYAEHNYWGGGNPHTGTGSKTYYGPAYFDWNPCDYVEQFSVPGGEDIEGNMKGGGAGGFGTIADAEEDARDLLKDAIDDEAENPARAMEAYRRVITRFGNSSAAPIAVERLLWMVRNHFADNRRLDELNGLNIFYRSLADTSQSRALAWKARRAALWTLAAMHNYDAAIAGFENIVENHNCLADSIFAVIDIGTLHLEAEAWAERDTVDRVQAVPGRMHELCPADWPSHRRKTDELLAMLNGSAYDAEPLIPDDYFLAQNYPNPFNSTTCIRYGLPDEGQVKITIFDLTGRRVKTLVNEAMKAGYYTMVWEGRNESGIPVSSGVYFCCLDVNNEQRVKKLALIR